MKRGTPNHPKVKRLARVLEIPRGYAVGILEGLWHCTARYAPQGNIGKLEDDEIADECGYEGDPATLIAALIECRWLDTCETSRLLVHDWKDHAESATKKYLKDNNLRFLDVKAVESKQVETCAHKSKQVATDVDKLGHTRPEPEPEPEPDTRPEPSVGETDDSTDRRRTSFASLHRLIGHDPGTADIALERYAEGIPDSVSVHGNQHDRWELIDRALSHAIESGADCQTVRGAVKYTAAIVERCITNECWPGEFPDARAGPRKNSHDLDALLKASSKGT